MRKATVAAVAALSLTACGAHDAQSQPAKQAIAVQSTTAKTTSFATKVNLAGSLTATSQAQVGAMTPGRVEAIYVRVGDHVHAGEVVAQVDASSYGAQLAGARAGAVAAREGAVAAQAGVAQAQSQLHLATVTAARMRALYSEGAISRQQYDQVQANLAAARSGYAQAQASALSASAQRAQAQAGVAAASVPVAQASVTAPFDGVVTSRFVDTGAVVGPGSPIVALQGSSGLELDVAIPEDDAVAVRLGAPVRVRIDALGGKQTTGTVRGIAPSDNAALRSSTLRIAVTPVPGATAGMFARVTLEGAQHRGIGVPLSSIVTRGGQSGVFEIDGGTATFIPVTTLGINGATAEVQGVKAGAKIATSMLGQLTDGAAVSESR